MSDKCDQPSADVGRLGIVACDIVKSELEACVTESDVILRFLDYSLHSTPREMLGKITQAVDQIKAQGADRVALGYGLCSNGVVGFVTDAPLVMPRCHDCISMLLGSPKRYFEMFRLHPGTYFLTEGWVRNNADPLSTVEIKYTPRMGAKKALRGMSLELANYKAFCFVDNGVGDADAVKARTKENCEAFKKEYLEVQADLDYFKALVTGPHPEDDFIILPSGQELLNDYFYNII
jgi:hypothetical protein